MKVLGSMFIIPAQQIILLNCLSKRSAVSLLLVLLFALSACGSKQVEHPASDIESTFPSPPLPFTPANTPVSEPTAATFSSPVPVPLPCNEAFCVQQGHFILQRPIAAEFVDYVDHTYRYGSTANGLLPTHRGVEFVNPQGTPVLAAADGVVIVAGNDYEEPLADFPAFYGNVVVIEHQLENLQSPIYTLYGHLFETRVETGQTVQAGDIIGVVGFTGAAIGEHLHFEVRLGGNSYQATRNPELWLLPHLDEFGQPNGAIVGRVVDEYGNSIYLPTVTIEQFDPVSDEILAVYYVEGYADWTVNGDDLWGEAFALGNIPAGHYRVSFVAYGLQTYVIEVLPGLVTVITFDAEKN